MAADVELMPLLIGISRWLVAVTSPGNLRFGSNQLSGTVPAQLTSFPSTSAAWSYSCITNSAVSSSGCDMAERQALIDFYLSTGGPYWTSSSGWMTATHPCTWYGLSCSGGSLTGGSIV